MVPIEREGFSTKSQKVMPHIRDLVPGSLRAFQRQSSVPHGEEGETYMRSYRLLGAIGWISVPVIIVLATIYF